MSESDEKWVTKNADGNISLDAYAGMSRDELKERCRKLVGALGDWRFAAMSAATDGLNTIENVREPYRSKIASMIEAYSDDESSTSAPRNDRAAVIEECAKHLETSYPDHAWLNAACAAIRSLAS